MTTTDELRSLFQRAVQRTEDDRVQVMLTGKRVDATTVTLAGAARDKVWVRSTDDSREQTQAWGSSSIANAHVRVRRNAAGELEMIGPAYGSGMATGIQASVTLPVLDGRLTRATWYGHNLSPARVRRSDGGGLNVTVEPFVFNGVAYATQEVTLTAPGTASKQAYCCVVLNPLTGAFSQVTGSNFDANTPVTDDEAYNSATLALGLVPLGGFLIANGATTLEGARWVDARTYIEARGPLHNYAATSNPGVGDDSADGYSVGSLWHNTTADTLYACLDATVGAAVWKLLTAALTVEDEGVALTQRTTINFTGAGVSATDSGGKTVVSISGGGGGSGNVVTPQDYTASRPASPNTGDVVVNKDAPSWEVRHDSAWNPYGPIWQLTPPPTSGWSWEQQGTSSETQAKNIIYLLLAANGGAGARLRFRYRTAPSTPYTLTVAMTAVAAIASDIHAGMALYFRQSSTGKIVQFRVITQPSIGVFKWDSATAFNSTYVGSGVKTMFMGSPLWMRISDDGTNRVCSYSTDGFNFLTIHTVGRTDFLTADQIGWGAEMSNSTGDAGVSLLSWKVT